MMPATPPEIVAVLVNVVIVLVFVTPYCVPDTLPLLISVVIVPVFATPLDPAEMLPAAVMFKSVTAPELLHGPVCPLLIVVEAPMGSEPTHPLPLARTSAKTVSINPAHNSKVAGRLARD